MKIPAFSLEYFSSVEVALSFYQPTISVPPTPRISHTPTTTYGSAGSTEGHWGREAATCYSAGTTPPSSYQPGRIPLERGDSQTQSYSTSPEHHHGRRSNASFTSVFAASLSRGNSNTSQSSPPRKRTSPDHSTAGSLAPGGVTWGTNTVFAPPSDEPLMESSGAYSESEEDDDEERLPSSDGMKMTVTLKNQDLFDGEGRPNTPLLSSRTSMRHRGYRESYANLLGIWRLEIQRLEVLKINGLQLSSSEIQQHQDQSLLTTEGEGQRTAGEKAEQEWTGLHIESAASVRKHTRSNSQTTQQPTSQKEKTRLSCSMCNSLIQGIYAPCFHCGHVLHSHCHRTWFDPKLPTPTMTTTTADVTGVEKKPKPPRTCPTGCGCSCTKNAMVIPRFLVEKEDDSKYVHQPGPSYHHPLPLHHHHQGDLDAEENSLRRNWEDWGYFTSSSAAAAAAAYNNTLGRDGLRSSRAIRGGGGEEQGLLLSGGNPNRGFISGGDFAGG
ncbi:MAG: hypothetical protein M1816_006531 [Peltula sp. TS41687]|nr:MAG: hypothetical protein M1816_006531 [Peltula sp. TS41687]